MKRLLITGATGFIGRHCISPAIAAGFETHAVASVRPLSDFPSVRWHSLDLLAPGGVERLIAEIAPTHILHLAWETTHGSYWSSPANLDWLAFGARMTAAFAKIGGVRIVAAGTCAEYDWSHGYMVEEATPERPSAFYGRIKLAHHRMLMASAAQFGFTAATARVFYCYGPFENENRLIPYACRQFVAGEEARFSLCDTYRDFLHVEDVGRGVVALLGAETTGACNVSSGDPSRLSDVVSRIADIAERRDLVRFGAVPGRADDAPMVVGDNRVLRSTGWRPSISLDEGLRSTYDWWRNRKSAT